MTKRYTGGVVSSAVPTVNAATASGVFLLSQQADAQAKNNWPPFKVEKSLRFRAANSAYLSRTPAAASNRKTWTWSGWVKRGTISADAPHFALFSCETVTSQTYTSIYFVANKIYLDTAASNVETMRVYTDAVFRDPSAWYHVVAVFDSTQATATNRRAIYINGVLQTLTVSTNPAQNLEPLINSTVEHSIGRNPLNGAYFDGYMADVNFIDGQALTPSSFGATDKDGNWSPIAYTGTYGQNGYYINFKDATSTTTLGYDYSGNGNHYTSSGISVTTGTTYDSMIDVPEDQSDGTANNRGNYATLNSLHGQSTSGWVTPTFSNGSLSISSSMTNNQAGGNYSLSTQQVTSGKWYAEFTCGTRSGIPVAGNDDFGVVVGIAPTAAASYCPDIGVVYKATNGQVRIDGASGTSYGNSYTTGDVIGVALDMDNGKVWFAKNGTWQASGDPAAGTNQAASSRTGLYGIGLQLNTFANAGAYTTSASANFGQRPFSYTPPTGFKALNTFNLPEPTIKQPNKHFDATLYTGTSSAQSITNAGGFQPDFVWTKSRSNAAYHGLTDSVRGVSKGLFTNATDSESSAADNYVTAFNSNGFSVNQGSASGYSGYTYVGWQWKGGGTAVTNTNGTITSQVSANPTAGFSIVTYTGTLSGAGTATVGHGLSVAPSMIIFKARNATGSWPVQHISLAANNTLNLSGTNLSLDQTSNGNLPKPTASVFYTNWTTGMNISGQTQVAYCFAPIAGYSAFGSYVGNGSNSGPFIYTGFRPKWILYKATSGSAYYWSIYDSSRNTYNVANKILYPNTSDAEETYAYIDILSNGFKIIASGSNGNESGSNYVYAAFAETPFKYSRSS